MTGILAYGSLIDSEAFAADAEGRSHAVPVRVRGYRRLFNQKPSFAEAPGGFAGVLNVERSRQHWINAVCLLIDNNRITPLELAELEYERAYVCRRDIACYPGHALPEELVSYIYVGREEKRDREILPNQEHLGRCIDGAANWGDTFFLEFVATTYLASGVSLQEYLAAETR